MRQSQLFSRTKKDAPKDEVSVNAQLLIRGGYVDKLTSGVYSLLPLGLRVIKKIEDIIRREMNNLGAQELLLPALHPKQLWETTGRWETMDDLYKLRDSGEREFALGPTHEEVIVPLVQKHLTSYKDLPTAVYQLQTKFRMELRAKSGLLRGREFIMKDLYSFHLTEADLDDYYNQVKVAYQRIFSALGIGEATYVTFASGGSFAKYSHEFQTISEAGEDLIFICANCQTAINREIKDDVPACPECGQTKFQEAKAIETGNIFKLMDRYSRPFGLSLVNETGQNQPVLMGCYGIGISRLLGVIVERFHDDKGITWPVAVAPFTVHLLSVGSTDTADNVYQKMEQAGLSVLYDDRAVSAGVKFADSDLLGLPYRLVVSDKTGDLIEIKRRDSVETQQLPLEAVIKLLQDVQATSRQI